DEYRARSYLTLYYGVRYSYFPSPNDKNGRLSNFVPSLHNAANAPQVTGAGARIAGTGNYCDGIIVNSQNFQTGPSIFNCNPTAHGGGKYTLDFPKPDLAPRGGGGGAPSPGGKRVVRRGYGVSHERVVVAPFKKNIGANPPYQETVTATNTR